MIDFMRYRLLYVIISGVILIPGIYSLIRYGLKPSLDFTGGTLIEFQVDKEPTSDEVKSTLETGQISVASVQTTDQQTYIIRTESMTPDQYQNLQNNLSKTYGTFKEVRFETVGPTLGRELLTKTVAASVLAIIGILLYTAWAFKNIRFGISAIFALIHDILVVIGVFSLLGVLFKVEVDTLFVTALLTTMSFSVHDTIVVFDRIRETQKKYHKASFEDIINTSLAETMARSLNNSLTIIFMLLALFLMGGETIKWFVLALLIGTISGTYSSPFVATPILYTWHKFKNDK